ncbi:hypothetical protein SAMN05216312_12252 [Cohnella sp. OV330]|uniref:hypothetical protein n=1 Tax=Cohnella sp. OV330 TaxID=1855288 RepID=UPI0008F14F3E|nr:hypothetical protein [Cohnella sp. OV330]SFB62735.1 hypothetical protein SAMN05216312_12252 [Cohnella sp. OV330]
MSTQEPPVSIPSPEVITIVELSKRLKIRRRSAYDLASEPGFPVLNLGGRGARIIWTDALDWLRKNKGGIAQ